MIELPPGRELNMLVNEITEYGQATYPPLGKLEIRRYSEQLKEAMLLVYFREDWNWVFRKTGAPNNKWFVTIERQSSLHPGRLDLHSTTISSESTLLGHAICLAFLQAHEVEKKELLSNIDVAIDSDRHRGAPTDKRAEIQIAQIIAELADEHTLYEIADDMDLKLTDLKDALNAASVWLCQERDNHDKS